MSVSIQYTFTDTCRDSERLIHSPQQTHTSTHTCRSSWSVPVIADGLFAPPSLSLCLSVVQSTNLFPIFLPLCFPLCPSVAILLTLPFLCCLSPLLLSSLCCSCPCLLLSLFLLLFLSPFFLYPHVPLSHRFTLPLFLFSLLHMICAFGNVCLCVSCGRLLELTRPLAVPCHATLMLCQCVCLCVCVCPQD